MIPIFSLSQLVPREKRKSAENRNQRQRKKRLKHYFSVQNKEHSTQKWKLAQELPTKKTQPLFFSSVPALLTYECFLLPPSLMKERFLFLSCSPPSCLPPSSQFFFLLQPLSGLLCVRIGQKSNGKSHQGKFRQCNP